MEAESDEDPAAAGLRWNTGCIGCLLPLMAGMALLFVYWALRPGEAPADGRHGWLIEQARAMTVGGVSVPFLLFAAYLIYEFARFGLRWADGAAVRVDEEGLLFHSSLLRRRRVPWAEVRGVQRRASLRGGGKVREIVFTLADRSVVVRGFDDEDGSADAFVARVRERIERR